MSYSLTDIASYYSTHNDNDFINYINKYSSDQINHIIKQTLEFAYSNSSFFRERDTSLINLTYEHNNNKHGFDGFDIQNNTPLEFKAENIKSNKYKFNGKISFNDFTKSIYNRYNEENPTIVCSAFIHSKLICALSIKFNDINNIFYNLLQQNKNERCCVFYNLSKDISLKSLKVEFLSPYWKDYLDYINKDIQTLLLNFKNIYIHQHENKSDFIKMLYLTSNNDNNFIKDLSQYNKSDLIEFFIKILNDLIQDKNTSTIREKIACQIVGYKYSPGRGYDGYKMENNNKIFCEIKSQICNKLSKNILKCKGSFSDYNIKLLERFKSLNINIYSTGFFEGKLIYIIRYNMNENPNLYNYIKYILLKNKQKNKRHISWDISKLENRHVDYVNEYFIDKCYLNKKLYKIQKNSLNDILQFEYDK
ncbi:MAG: hypothetical protein PHF86_09245 [Candidatus Nanoarchaeia archaeon]|jgi:hypothetical protein|nr:hypothetical protein [Candidatus Nanoarchaeia archaeon]